MRRTKLGSTNLERRGEKRAAVRSVVLSTLLQLCVIAVLLYCWRGRQPGLMKNVLLFLAVTDLITIPFTVVALWQRVREIEKGELDEARKY